jgi:hypothetical protein
LVITIFAVHRAASLSCALPFERQGGKNAGNFAINPHGFPSLPAFRFRTNKHLEVYTRRPDSSGAGSRNSAHSHTLPQPSKTSHAIIRGSIVDAPSWSAAKIANDIGGAMNVDFRTLMELVARRLLGEQNKRLSRPPKDVRFGTHGSMSVNLETGQFFDHEANIGGGVLDLINRECGGNHRDAMDWLRREGLIPERPSSDGSRKTERPNSGNGAFSRKIAKAFDYLDEFGVLLYQSVRYEPKDFSQRRPDGNGGWIDNLDGVRRVLYRLPEVIAAVEAGKSIAIVEGEKDADNLRELGFVATTCPMGAGKWDLAYNEYLCGADDVVIVGDNDDAGRKHVQNVAQQLAGVAKRVRVLELVAQWKECPHKGDVSDWIETGGDTNQLIAWIESAPEWSPPAAAWQRGTFTAEQLRQMRFKPISWIIPDIIAAEGVTLLCSKPKFGKSWLVYDLCIAATADRYTLGEKKPMQGDVLYLALEDSKRRLQRRMTKLLPSFQANWPKKLTMTTEWRRLHEGGLDDIRSWYEHVKAKGGKPILAVIDVLAKVRKPTGNKPVYEADYEALTGLCQLAHELNVAIVVIHHTRKMAADDLMETVNGSYGITGAVDTVLVMASSKTGGAVLDIRGRDVESAELAIVFSKDACRWTILGAAAEIHVSDQRKAIIAALVEYGGPMKITELVAATGMKRNPLELLLGKMVQQQAIKRVSPGVYAHKDWQPPPENEPGRDGERVKTRTDRQTDVQANGRAKKSESPDLSASPDRQDRSDRSRPTETARTASVRSVWPLSTTGQIEDRPQDPDKAEKIVDICSSVRSVREFTRATDSQDPPGERVKTQTEQTDGQIETQATEEPEVLVSGDLSGLGTVRTDQTDGHKAGRDDDLTIPPILDRRGEVIRICAQCGAGRSDDQPTIEIIGKHRKRLWVHERGGLRSWEKENAKEPSPGTIRPRSAS